MSGNFNFLKKIDIDLYNIISEAEKLYRDEYFEQCMVQTRRFGEQICKTMLEENGIQTGSFDNMLAVLQDKQQGSVQEKEFINDLYFLKKNGNNAVHSSQVKKEASVALKCLKCSFEAAINYCVYNKGASANILKLDYDTELLITGEKSKQSLSQRHKAVKQAQNPQSVQYENNTIQNNKTNPQKNEKILIKFSKMNFKIPLFWKLILFLCCISFCITAVLSAGIAIKSIFTQ